MTAAERSILIDVLREVVRNGVPPDALMNPQEGPAYKALYDWWHEQWAPTLQKVRRLLDAAPRNNDDPESEEVGS